MNELKKLENDKIEEFIEWNGDVDVF